MPDEKLKKVMLDTFVNIDNVFCVFDDRKKVLRILKELFNHCTSFKKLLMKHHYLILTVLLSKYDKQCHLYINKAYMNKQGRLDTDNGLENRDEYLASVIG